MLRTHSDTLEAVLQAHARELGDDFVAYRNHTYRVVNFCTSLPPAGDDALEKFAIAAAYHDLGIWTARTFDYLGPSVDLARAHLAQAGRSSWAPEIEAMILEHHRITPSRVHAEWLVEPFRKADWVDITRGLVAHGVPRSLRRVVFATWPDAGFHRRLVLLTLGRLRTHPLNPLPMLRL